MRRSASEVIRNLETRIARLEKSASTPTLAPLNLSMKSHNVLTILKTSLQNAKVVKEFFWKQHDFDGEILLEDLERGDVLVCSFLTGSNPRSENYVVIRRRTFFGGVVAQYIEGFFGNRKEAINYAQRVASALQYRVKGTFS